MKDYDDFYTKHPTLTWILTGIISILCLGISFWFYYKLFTHIDFF